MSDSASDSSKEDALRAELVADRAITSTYRVFDELGIPGADHFVLMVALLRAHEKLQSELEKALKRHKISLAQYMMMSNLHLRGPNRPLLVGRLARRMLVHPTTVTLRLDQLEERGLVTRDRRSNDRRGVWVSLTDSGCDLLQQAHRDLAKCDFALPGISSESALKLVTGLMPLVQHDADDAGPGSIEAESEAKSQGG